MQSLIEPLRALWRKHPWFIAALGLAAVASIGIAVVAGRDTRVALFGQSLDPEQVTEVVTQLALWNVPFITTVDNVRVDMSRRSDVLLKLSLAGVPHAHLTSSHEMLANAGPLTPQSVLDAQQIEGLAGDLALGLRGMSGISDARVIIAPAKPAFFADDASHEAGASVRLTLQPGTVLTRDQIEGIRAFVSAGVPGLAVGHVAILDDRGVALGRSPTSGTDQATVLQASLQSALDTAFGSGATIVRVRAVYDPLSREVHEVKRIPLGGRSIGTTTVDERFTGDRKRYSKLQASEDRGSDVQEEKTEAPAGRLTRLCVAVMVDAARRLDLAKLRDLATATLGLVTQQGDTLSVQEFAFTRPEMSRPSRWVTSFGLLATILPTLIVVVGMLVVARWSAKPVMQALVAWQQRLAVQRASGVVAGFAPAQVRGALQGEPPHTAAAIISALPTATATAVLEMYPPEERAAIVRRMQRATPPVVPDYQALLRHG